MAIRLVRLGAAHVQRMDATALCTLDDRALEALGETDVLLLAHDTISDPVGHIVRRIVRAPEHASREAGAVLQWISSGARYVPVAFRVGALVDFARFRFRVKPLALPGTDARSFREPPALAA